MLLVTAILAALLSVPVLAATVTVTAPQANATSPEVVRIGVYVMDFKSFAVEEGSVKADFYLSLGPVPMSRSVTSNSSTGI